jgi:sugar phosphate isomerase/epimerase
MRSVPIGLQLYAVRAECEKDLPATLEAVAAVGYQGVEPWGYDGGAVAWKGRPAAELRRLLDASGLACCGMHVATGALVGDALRRTVELNKVLGNRYLIIAADSRRMASRAGIAELASILDRAAEAVRPEGMRVGYHAHGFDFAKIDGRTAWEILFSSTRPEVVMQLDNGNCASGGGDPIAMLRAFPGRARTVHVKEHGGPPGSVIGEGAADWAETFRLCEELHHTEWYVVEECNEDGTGFDVCRRSLAGLRRLLGARARP